MKTYFFSVASIPPENREPEVFFVLGGIWEEISTIGFGFCQEKFLVYLKDVIK